MGWAPGKKIIPDQGKPKPAFTSPEMASDLPEPPAPPATTSFCTTELPPASLSVDSCQPEPKADFRVPSSKSLISPEAGGCAAGAVAGAAAAWDAALARGISWPIFQTLRMSRLAVTSAV